MLGETIIKKFAKKKLGFGTLVVALRFGLNAMIRCSTTNIGLSPRLKNLFGMISLYLPRWLGWGWLDLWKLVPTQPKPSSKVWANLGVLGMSFVGETIWRLACLEPCRPSRLRLCIRCYGLAWVPQPMHSCGHSRNKVLSLFIFFSFSNFIFLRPCLYPCTILKLQTNDHFGLVKLQLKVPQEIRSMWKHIIDICPTWKALCVFETIIVSWLFHNVHVMIHQALH